MISLFYLQLKPFFFRKQARAVVKGCSPEMISRTFKDHNLGGQPGQLPAGKLQGAEIENRNHGLMRG